MLKVIVLVSSLFAGAPTEATPEAKAEKKAAMKQKMLEKFDANNDGTLDKTERTAMREQRATAMFKRLDKNGDGMLSLAEFKEAKRFGKRHHFGARRGFRDGLKSR